MSDDGQGTWCVDFVIRKSKKGFAIFHVSFGKWAANNGGMDSIWLDGFQSVGEARSHIRKCFGDFMPKIVDET